VNNIQNSNEPQDAIKIKKKKKKKKRSNKSKDNSKATSKISSKEADNLYNEQSVNNIIRDTQKNLIKLPSREDFLLDQKLLSFP
jgi:hypothetical protein